MNSENIVFSGEVQLLNWSETHNGGAKIVLQLADAADLEKFKVMTVKKGNQAGQRLAVVMVEIGEDERPVPQPAPKQRIGDLCLMACTFCADPDFQYWAHTQNGQCQTEAEAKQFVLDVCLIDSRKELDADKTAGALFHTAIREPYLKWKSQP